MSELVELDQGTLRGHRTPLCWEYLGIPYAPAPVGEYRFAAPGPPPRWDGVREAAEYGPTAPKPGYPAPVNELLPDPSVPGEDYLNLNVWTPDPTATDLPVLVWIHGGAFVNGSGAVPAYRGDRFARDGVVTVTLNYRLGLEGFGLIAGRPSNRGLLDQIAALRWVRDNIAMFGGDANQVTIAGESAGAMSIGALLAMPAATGLFRRAITQSGAGHHVLRSATAAKVTAAVAAQLGVEPTADALATVPIDALIKAQSAIALQVQLERDPAKWGEIAVNMMAFEPVVDGDTLPLRPIDAIDAGASADVGLLTGTNTDEHALFLVPTGIVAAATEQTVTSMLAGLGLDPASALSVYREQYPQATPGELLTFVLTDWFFRVPAVRLAEARTGDTYVYEFGWRTPVWNGALGACHALEIGFAFDTLADGLEMAGDSAPQQIADEMHRAWVAFAATGDPGWPAYGAERTVRHFDLESDTVQNPLAATLAVWSGTR